MKSLLISGTYFPPQVGGISHFMASIGSTLGAEHICCLTGVREYDDQAQERLGVRIYRRPAAFAKSTPIQAVGLSAAMVQIMVQERPQIVQLATVSEGYLGLWLRRWLNLPFVIYAHGNEILGVMQERWPKPRLALQQADRIFAVSQFTADLVRKVGVAPERIAIVHPGCDSETMRPLSPKPELQQKFLGTRAGDNIILTVGNLVARKGHDMVLRALPHVLHRLPDVTYLIVGDGPYRTHLETLTGTLGIQEHVVFAGQVADQDLPDIYALSTVFAMPSRAQIESCDVEGFGIVFLEANACGKPVIGGRSGGIPEAIVDGETGILVNPDDPEEIAQALVQLLSNYDLATRLGQQGRARVLHNFNWDKVGNTVQSILHSVLRETSKRN